LANSNSRVIITGTGDFNGVFTDNEGGDGNVGLAVC
jgi:hypothetical protein